MDYETAKKQINEAGFIVDAAPVGQLHVDVRRDLTGPYFSIMLPITDGEDAAELLAASIEQADKHLPPLAE